jgi:mannose/fructose/sorbose-specific phosphotransferase system IIB component
MAVLFSRIDDRLVHGQVVESWLPFLNIKEILITCDKVAMDKSRIDLMRFSLPEHIELKVKTVEQTIKYLKQHKTKDKILLIPPSPCEIIQLVDGGIKLDTVNVGGMHYSVGKMQIGRAVFINEKDIQCLKKIASKGVKLEGRGVPTDKPVDILSRLSQ